MLKKNNVQMHTANLIVYRCILHFSEKFVNRFYRNIDIIFLIKFVKNA